MTRRNEKDVEQQECGHKEVERETEREREREREREKGGLGGVAKRRREMNEQRDDCRA